MAESRARSLANLGNQNVLSVDSSSLDVGISSASPDSDLNVGASIKMDGPSGIVTATTFSGSFSGDGSALTGVANTDFIVSIATTATRVVVTGGVNVTGVVTATSFTGDGANLTNVGVDTATVDTGSLNVSGISTLTGAVGFGNSATFDDGASKGVYLGNSHDLQLYHSGNSFLKNINNSVDLRIISDAVDIKGNSSDEQLAKFTLNGSVDLYYNNVNRLETATHGVNFEHAGTASTSRINPGGSVGVGIGVTTTTGRDAVSAGGTVTGQIVFNETTGFAQVYNGTTWDNMSNKFTASGGTEATPGNGYKYHVFTSPGNFVADQTGTIDLLVVAGGGGGGGGSDSTWYPGSGGGAGGVVYGTGKSISSGTYAVVVGTGGAGGAGAPGSGPATNGTTGNLSSFGSPGSPHFGQPDYVLAKGGGAGGWGAPPGSSGTPSASMSGGSGGGAPSHGPTGGGPSTQGSTNPAFTDYGNAGGPNPNPSGLSFGGGGAGAAGQGSNTQHPSQDMPSGDGGAGQPFPAFASPLVGPAIPSPLQSAFNTAVGPTGLYGGGGGGGQANTPGLPTGQAQAGEGGPGGGADGGPPSGDSSNNGVSGTGGGGGGGGTLYGDRGYAGSSGGPGIVIVRYTA